MCACEKKGNRVTRAASFSCCSLSLSLSLLKALNHDNSPPPSWWLVVCSGLGRGGVERINQCPLPSSLSSPLFFAIAKPPGVYAHFPDQTKMQNRPIHDVCNSLQHCIFLSSCTDFKGKIVS